MKLARLGVISFVLTVSFVLQGYSQTVYSGKIIDSVSKSSISYITVRLLKEGIYSKADENGLFKIITTKALPNDSLIFSGVGYLPNKISVKELQQKSTIKMREIVNTLVTVNISNKIIEKQLNKYSLSSYSPTFYAYQIAEKFEMPDGLSRLKSISFHRILNYYGANNTIKFRIRVYDVDESTSGPGEDLCLQKLEFDDAGNGLVKIDLSKYRIDIPGKYFFVSIEKVLIPLNERYELELKPFSFIKDRYSKSFFTYNTDYEPILYGTQKRGEYWLLDHLGDKWKKIKFSLAINATVTN